VAFESSVEIEPSITRLRDFLIIAIPFSVLRRIELSPRFSAEKQKAIDNFLLFRGPSLVAIKKEILE